MKTKWNQKNVMRKGIMKKQVKLQDDNKEGPTGSGTPLRCQREHIIWAAVFHTKQQWKFQKLDNSQVSKRAAVMRNMCYGTKHPTDLVKMALDYLKDAEGCEARKGFLKSVTELYVSQENWWKDFDKDTTSVIVQSFEIRKRTNAVVKETKERAKEQPRGSKDPAPDQERRKPRNARRVEVYDISQGDEEMVVIDELMQWYMDEEVERVRVINYQDHQLEWNELIEVCLDTMRFR